MRWRKPSARPYSQMVLSEPVSSSAICVPLAPMPTRVEGVDEAAHRIGLMWAFPWFCARIFIPHDRGRDMIDEIDAYLPAVDAICRRSREEY